MLEFNEYNNKTILDHIEQNNIGFFNENFINWFKEYKNYHEIKNPYSDFLNWLHFASKTNKEKIVEYFFTNEEIVELFTQPPHHSLQRNFIFPQSDLQSFFYHSFHHNNHNLMKVIFNSSKNAKKAFTDFIFGQDIPFTNNDEDLFNYGLRTWKTSNNNTLENKIKELNIEHTSFNDFCKNLDNMLKEQFLIDYPEQYKLFMQTLLRYGAIHDNVQLVDYVLNSKNLKFNAKASYNFQQSYVKACENNSYNVIDLIINNIYEENETNINKENIILKHGLNAACRHLDNILAKKILSHEKIQHNIQSYVDLNAAFNQACLSLNEEIIPYLVQASIVTNEFNEKTSVVINNYPYLDIIHSYQNYFLNNVDKNKLISMIDCLLNEPSLNPQSYKNFHTIIIGSSSINAKNLFCNYMKNGIIEVMDYLLFKSPDFIQSEIQPLINDQLFVDLCQSSLNQDKIISVVNYLIYELDINITSKLNSDLKTYLSQQETEKTDNFNTIFLAKYILEQYDMLKFNQKLNVKINESSDIQAIKKKKL